jgi:hypothetical protein
MVGLQSNGDEAAESPQVDVAILSAVVDPLALRSTLENLEKLWPKE